MPLLATAATEPSGPGSQSHRARGRPAAPRPSTTTWARRARSRPWPDPIPAHSWLVTVSLRCAPSQSPAMTSTPPYRRATDSSLRRRAADGRDGGRRTTRSQPSSRVATTCGQLEPGSGTSSSRSGSRPAPAAAATPRAGSPATAHQAPAPDAAAARARQSRPHAPVAITDPRGSPAGSSPASAGSTGRAPEPVRSPGTPWTPESAGVAEGAATGARSALEGLRESGKSAVTCGISALMRRHYRICIRICQGSI